MTIQERDFIIASHTRAEAALAGHAEAVTAELGGAVEQLAGAFDALQAMAEVQQADRWAGTGALWLRG